MLIQFSIKNFKTFKERTTLNLVASNYDKTTREIENVQEVSNFNLRLLKSAVIYGANASGKSKFIEALKFMRGFVANSSKDSQKGDSINIEPFRLETTSNEHPTEFEVIFIQNNEMFRYGFEVTRTTVLSEWLYHRPKTKEIELFYRTKQDFGIHKRSFSKGLRLAKEGLIRENALLLSVAAQFNDDIAANVLNWFKKLRTLSGLDEDSYQGFTMKQTLDPIHKKRILSLLKEADIGIEDISLESLDINKLPLDMPKELKETIIKKVENDRAEFFSDVLATHKKYNIKKEHVGDVKFSMETEESSGTKKFFALTGPILDSLANGFILAVDELDSKLHPNLVSKLVSLFNSKELNPNSAQLIFNTHDTNLLSLGLFRRDQVWFTQKDRLGAAQLFSLTDFKSDVKKNENFEENYILGKYGAIPYLNNFGNFLTSDKPVKRKNEK